MKQIITVWVTLNTIMFDRLLIKYLRAIFSISNSDELSTDFDIISWVNDECVVDGVSRVTEGCHSD
jgi:hypothetical protein